MDVSLDLYVWLVVLFFLVIVGLILWVIIRWYKLFEKQQRVTVGKLKVIKKPTPEYQLAYGKSYLIFETNSDQAPKIFTGYVRRGSRGLGITRMYPEKFKEKYKLSNVSILWLSRAQTTGSITPTNLGVLLEEIKEYISQKGDSIVLLEGLEYLIVENEFERVLKFINSLEDEIALNNSRLIISINPNALDSKKRALLEESAKQLSG